MYSGVFPVLPTTFDEHGGLDLESQKRSADFLIAAGVNGICILANYSEQFSLLDAERQQLTQMLLAHVAGRVPVIVTSSHFSSAVAAARSREAQQLGAAMVMLMPPYHGATIRATEEGILEFFRAVSDAISIPIMLQDAPVSGVSLSAALLARLAQEVERLKYFKIEGPGATAKLRDLIARSGQGIDGPFDGEEAVTLLPDLDAGATGTMPSSMIPEILARVVSLYRSGNRGEAVALYERWLPLLHYENRQCGLQATKVLMKEGGIIASEATRHPFAPLNPATRAGLLEIARRLDPLILRWAR
jgi:dihydrodipicolinate synthase/N-acetylneuraminate lyase